MKTITTIIQERGGEWPSYIADYCFETFWLVGESVGPIDTNAVGGGWTQEVKFGRQVGAEDLPDEDDCGDNTFHVLGQDDDCPDRCVVGGEYSEAAGELANEAAQEAAMCGYETILYG